MSKSISVGPLGKRAAKLRGELKNLVRFEVGTTCYAFDVASVDEVIHPVRITPLPRMGVAVSGVADHRGRVIPIVALRPRFGMPDREPTRLTKWILVRSAHGLVAFVVDRVLDVASTEGNLTAAPSVGGAEHERALRGVVSIDGQLVFVLDEDRLANVLSGLEDAIRESQRP
ncbi:MAG TPA: chemotaxis protein CheW [Polyangiaceae bacterium]|jgi:purine-binding chemotaxis protein CheW|nr:chemotaxis protein CheW [Polyangiaceae bacterium]